MDQALISLMAASTAFVGSHFAMSHPLRAPMVRVLGDKGFMGVYSLVSIFALFWMDRAFRAAPAADGPGAGAAGWAAASVLTLLALVLILGSLKGNPALPDPTGRPAIPAEVRGVFLVTRHPMMWGIALWAIAHGLLVWSMRSLIVSVAILVLALLGAHLQDRKKQALLGADWQGWVARTSYWPHWQGLAGAGPVLWLLALAVWLAASWVHLWVAGIPAGIWFWIG